METASFEPSHTNSTGMKTTTGMSEKRPYHTLDSGVQGITNRNLWILIIVPILMRDLLLRYEPFMSKTYSLYVKGMPVAGSWGDHLTLDAIANVYNTRLWCIESAVNYECTRIGPVQDIPSTQDIYVGHIGEWHYMSVTPNKVDWLSKVYLLQFDLETGFSEMHA